MALMLFDECEKNLVDAFADRAYGKCRNLNFRYGELL